jgi:hypothetical protein
MIKSRNLREFIEKFNPDVNLMGFEGHDLKDDGVFLKTDGKYDGSSVYFRDIEMNEHLMAEVHSHGCRFFEFQCLLYDARKNGPQKKIFIQDKDIRTEEFYKKSISIFIDPIADCDDFKKRVLLANELVPHHSTVYEELISLDGKTTLSGSVYDGFDKVVFANDSWKLFYIERGGESLEIVFFKEQYLFEHILESVIHII